MRSFPRVQLLLGAILFSTGGVAIKGCSLAGFPLLDLRAAVAALAILIFLPASRSLGTRRSWLVAVSYGATVILYVLANKLTTAAETTFLQSTAPLYLVLLGPLLLKEPTRPGDLLFLVVVACGMALFFLGGSRVQETAPRPVLGNVLAALSGSTWALTIVGLRWLGRDPRGGEASAVLGGNLIAALAGLPWLVEVSGIGTRDWLIVAYLGIFQVGLAYVFVMAGLRKLPALEASLLLLLEPVLNPIWAFLVHGETIGRASALGGVVILAATLARALGDVRSRPRAGPRAGSKR